jgi:SSS family solute:Na+ symporter
MTLSSIEYILLAFYVVGLFVLGFVRSHRGHESAEEYLVAGRRISLPAFVVTLVSTWYGGILGVGEFSYKYGLSNWLVFGVPYYLYAVIFALFIAGRAWRTKFYTIPDQLEKAYGRNVSLAGAFFIFILATPAPYVLMIGVLCRMLLGWPLWLGVTLGSLLSMIYAFRGGLSFCNFLLCTPASPSFSCLLCGNSADGNFSRAICRRCTLPGTAETLRNIFSCGTSSP